MFSARVPLMMLSPGIRFATLSTQMAKPKGQPRCPIRLPFDRFSFPVVFVNLDPRTIEECAIEFPEFDKGQIGLLVMLRLAQQEYGQHSSASALSALRSARNAVLDFIRPGQLNEKQKTILVAWTAKP